MDVLIRARREWSLPVVTNWVLPRDHGVSSFRQMTPMADPAPSPIHIRQATLADVSRLVSMFEQYRAFYGATLDAVAARRFLTERLTRAESTVFVATAGEQTPQPVGFVQLYASFSSLAMRRIAIVNDLYVAHDWRRAGIARRLMAAAIDHAVADGAAAIELATRHTNGPALALYRQLGFRTDTEFARLYLPVPEARVCTPSGRGHSSGPT